MYAKWLLSLSLLILVTMVWDSSGTQVTSDGEAAIIDGLGSAGFRSSKTFAFAQRQRAEGRATIMTTDYSYCQTSSCSTPKTYCERKGNTCYAFHAEEAFMTGLCAEFLLLLGKCVYCGIRTFDDANPPTPDCVVMNIYTRCGDLNDLYEIKEMIINSGCPDYCAYNVSQYYDIAYGILSGCSPPCVVPS